MNSDHPAPHSDQGIVRQASVQNLTLTAAILTVLLVLSAAAIGWYAWIDEKADAVTNLTTITTLEATNADGYFTHLYAALKGLAEDLTRQNEQIDLDQAYILVKRFREIHTELFNVTLIRNDGEVLLTAKNAPGTIHATLANETSFTTYIDELKQGWEHKIGQPLVSVVSKVVIVPVRYAIKDRQGNLRYVVSANLSQEHLRSSWVEAPITAKAAIGLMRDNGFLLSRYPVPANLTLQQIYGQPRTGALINHLREKGFPLQGYVQGPSSLDGPDFLNAFHRLPSFSATLFVALPMSAIRESWWKRISGTYLVLFLLQIGGFLTYRYAVRRQTAWNGEQARLEAATHESEQRFRRLISHNNAIILQVEPSSGRILDANAAAEKFYGWSHDELCAMSIQDINQLDPEQIAVERQAAAADQRNYFVYPHRLANGEIRTVEVHSTPIIVSDQTILVSIIHDITERKQNELKLQQLNQQLLTQQQRLEKISRHIQGMIFQYQRWPDGRSALPYASEGIRAIYGVSPEDVVDDATPVFAVLHPDDLEQVAQSIEKSASTLTPWHDQYRVVLPGGKTIWIEGESTPERLPDGGVLWHGYIREITERKRVESELDTYRHHLEELVEKRTAELITTEAKATHLLQSSSDGLYGVDLEGRITFINTAACQLLGRTPEDVIGKSAHALFHHSRPDGSPYHAEDCPSHSAIRNGQEIRTDNEVYWHVDGHAVPVMFAVHPLVVNGVNNGAVISFVDMSEQRAAALARERAIVAAENLARVRSEFLSNMSHEIRTPINGVMGFAEIGYRNYQDPEKARNAFDKIRLSGNRLLGVINDVLDFSKIEAGKLHVERITVTLNEVIEQAVDVVQERADAKHIALRVVLAPDLPQTCLGDPLRMGQVLLNLLSNAVKFTEKGDVTLSVTLEKETLIFRVTDTGIGMNEEQISQLFAPFQQGDGTTTRRFGGTGLGLTIANRIAELMESEIRVQSQPGIGSTFEFRLPYVHADASPVAPLPTVEPSAVGKRLAGMTILVAEDEPINQQILELNLTDDGADVVMVSNGLQAVDRILQDGPSAYDIVLMDVQMPELGGFEATQRILELAPDLPIVGQTANAFAEDREKCLAAGMVGYIAKPIDPEALVRLVLQYVLARRSE